MNRFKLVPDEPKDSIGTMTVPCPMCGRDVVFLLLSDPDYTCRLVITPQLARPHVCPAPEDRPTQKAA